MRPYFLWGCIWLCCLIQGCGVPSGKLRTQTAEQAAQEAGWRKEVFPTRLFDITGFRPDQEMIQSPTMTIYFEGDGLAWISRSMVSTDPTPVNPVGLKLALGHPDRNVFYLSRPFQFGQTRNMDFRFWTSDRFAPEVIEAYVQILDRLKESRHIRDFHLVGYSGGGAIAALVAAKRNDVTMLITIAGNLNHQAWTAFHGVSPLTGSLNPADFSRDLMNIPQIHFYGEKDQVIPGRIAMAFASRFPPENRPETQVVKGVTHNRGWDGLWPKLHEKAWQKRQE